MKTKNINKNRKSVFILIILIALLIMSLFVFIFANGTKLNDDNSLDSKPSSLETVAFNDPDIQDVSEDHAINENGELVVFTKDENGNVVSKVVSSDNNSNNADNRHGVFHSHTWVPKYGTRQVQVATRYVVDQPVIIKSVTCCNVCGAKDVVYGVHQCNNGCFSSHTERITLQQEIGHYEPVYGSEQYVEYYYCTTCGVRQ